MSSVFGWLFREPCPDAGAAVDLGGDGVLDFVGLEAESLGSLYVGQGDHVVEFLDGPLQPQPVDRITGVEIGLDVNNATQQQLEAIPGIGSKSSWRIVSARAKAARNSGRPFETVQEAFSESGMPIPEFAGEVLVA